MKTNDFFEIMNNIDTDLIERAEKAHAKPRPIMRFTAIAAALVLISVTVFTVLPMLRPEDNNIVTDAIVWKNVFELFSPKGVGGGESNEAEAVMVESTFSEIKSKRFESYKIGNAFPLEKSAEFIGEELCEIKVRTGWYLHIEKKERDVRTVKAKVYAMKGVSPDAAVAVRFIEEPTGKTTEHYYAAVNTGYGFSTLLGFFEEFNAAVHMQMGDQILVTELDFGTEERTIEKYRFKDGGSGDMIKLLLALDAEAEVSGVFDAVDGKMKGCERMVSLTFALNSAGRTTNALYVFDNGYVAIRGFGDSVAFFKVGGEATAEIFRLLKENTELVTQIPVIPGGTLTEETTKITADEAVPE